MEPQLSPEDQVFMEMINGIWFRFDTDNNGYLDKRETKLFIKELLHADGLKQLYFIFDDVFDAIDHDKTGTIDKMEMIKFIKAINKRAKESSKEVDIPGDDPILRIVEETWDTYDSDMNGTLDRNEANVLLRDIFKFMGFDTNRITQQDYDKAFESIDLNKNGKITKTEWYIFVKGQIEKRKLINAIEEEQSKKREMEVQVDYVPSPRPTIPKASTATMVDFNNNVQIQADIEEEKIPKKSIQLQAGVPMIERQHDAAQMVQRIYRRLILFRRMFTYRSLKGVLYSRKYTINKMSGAMEIMSMHMLHNYLDQTCVNLKITIFDYVSKKFIYSGTYDYLDDVKNFNVFQLQKLTESSLKVLEFERSPFRDHIAVIQSIVNKNKFNTGNTNTGQYVNIDFNPPEFLKSESESSSSESSSSSSSSSSYSSEEIVKQVPIVKMKEPAVVERPSTPPPIIINLPPPKPAQTSSAATDMISVLIPRKIPVLRRTGLWALYFIMVHVKLWLARRRILNRNKLLCATSYRLNSRTSGMRFYKVELHKVRSRIDRDCQGEIGNLDEYYRLIAQETRPSRYKPLDSWYQIYETIYRQIQLPGEQEGDSVIMNEYFKKAVYMELDKKTDHVGVLKLQRKYIDPLVLFENGLIEPVYATEIPTPFKKPVEPIGEFEKESFEFEPKGHPGIKLLCRIIKRIRWQNINQTKKYKDWKIQVELVGAPDIYDYVTIFKRCKYCIDTDHLKKHLEVTFNNLTSPPSIKHMRLKIDNKIYVRSQMWLDHNLFSEQDYEFSASEEYTQDLIKVHFVQQSLPTPEIIEKKEDCKTPLFEIKIHSVQNVNPVTAENVVIYNNQGYQAHVKKKQLSWFPAKDVYSSSPDSSEDYDWVWEQKYLDDIQRDEFTTSRSYILMETRNVQKTKQNQQIMFYHPKAEEWLSGQQSFQYVASGIKIEIDKDNSLDIHVGIKEPSNSQQQPYMTQDVQREENQDYACTVYNFKNTQLGMYVFEAIHILKPMERAYLMKESLGGLTDEELFHYIDENLGINFMEREGPKKKNESKLIESISLAIEPAVFKIEFNQTRASMIILKLLRGFLTRQKFGNKLKKTVTYKAIKLEGNLKHISVVYQKLGLKNTFRACIFNQLNKKTRDDCHFIETTEMLGKNDLQQRLIIEWKDSRVISAKIFNLKELEEISKAEAKVKIVEEVKQVEEKKVVEVKEEKPLVKVEVKTTVKEEKVEEVKQIVPIVRQDSWSSAEDYVDKNEILEDVKILKQFIKTLQKKTKALDNGIDAWFRLFDADGSGEIEMREFLRMLEHLNIYIEARLVSMLFQVFDRRRQGCFTRVDFFDILDGTLMINYRKLVIKERAQWEKKQIEQKMMAQRQQAHQEASVKISTTTVVTDPNQPVFVAQKPLVPVIEQQKEPAVVAEPPQQPPKVVEKIPKEIKKPKEEDAAPNFDFGPPKVEQKPAPIVAQAPSPPLVQQQPPKVQAKPQVEEEKKQAAPQQPKVPEQPPQVVVEVQKQVTAQETLELYIQYLITHKKKLDDDSLFKDIDKNKNGSINFSEFNAYMEKLKNANKVIGVQDDPKYSVLTKQNMASLFRFIDVNNKAQIDLATFRLHFKPPPVVVVEQKQIIEEEVKMTADDVAPQDQVQAVIDMSHITGIDLIRNLFHCMSVKNMNIDQLFTKYDKDKNFLLSAKEFIPIFKQQAQIELSEVEIQNLTKYFKQKVNRTEIQKRELKKILEEGFTREIFDDYKVKEMIKILIKSGPFNFQEVKQDVMGDPSVSFRDFKVMLSPFGTMVNLNMICSYMDQRNAGFIRLKDIDDAFGLIDHYSPYPKKEEIIVIAEQAQAETCVEDIIKSFTHYLSQGTTIQSIIAEKKLFANNKLLPCAKLREIIEEKLKITFTNQDKQVLLKYVQDKYTRKELKKAELLELLDTKFPRKYSTPMALDAIRKTTELGIQKEIYKTQNLMEFKRLLYPYVEQYAKDQQTLNQIITNLTNYMDRDDNGQIHEQDLRGAFDVLGKYNPEKPVEVIKTDPIIVNWFDIIVPLREYIEGTNSSTDKIFEQYDKDKSYIIDTKEIHKMLKDKININIKPHELQIIPNAMRGLTGRTGVKKAEFAQFLNNWWDPCIKDKPVDATNSTPRPFNKDMAKSTLEKLVAHFGTRKQFKETFKAEDYTIERASFGEKKGDRVFFTMYSFKHFLFDCGVEDPDEIANFACSHYNKYGQVQFGADDLFGEDKSRDNDFE